MKKLYVSIIFLIFFLFPAWIYCQDFAEDRKKIQHILDSLSIKLNKPEVPLGYTLYYNCDSLAIFKKVKGDTITLLTPGSYTPMTYETSDFSIGSFKEWIKNRERFPPSFPKYFDEDGRIEIADYSETVFVFRNDSLYLRDVEDTVLLNKFNKSIDRYISSEIDSITMVNEIESASKENTAVTTYGFIFHKEMFNKSDTVKVSISLNPKDVKIVLQKFWKKEGLNCYNILIIGDCMGTKTMVSYTFDEKIKFLLWEGCSR